MLKDIIKQHFMVTGKLKLLKIQTTIKIVRHPGSDSIFQSYFFSLALNKIVCLLTLMQASSKESS